MPFEVFPIAGACQDKEIDPSRSSEEVAEDIRQVYENVAARSGRIVAEHSIKTNHFFAPGEPVDCLYIVAECKEKESKFASFLRGIDEFMSKS